MFRRLLTIGAVLTALLLVGGIACGDDDGSVNGSGAPTETQASDVPPDPLDVGDPTELPPGLPGTPPDIEANEAREPERSDLDRSAALNMIGRYQTGVGLCEDERILMTSPLISPSQSYSSGNVVVIGGSQWVAFRAHLANWDGAKWVTIASQSWKAQEVPLQGSEVVAGADFYIFDTGQFGPGVEGFPITADGYYAVWLDYYWYGNEHVAAGYTRDWGRVQEFRYGDYNVELRGFCRYPPF